MNDVFGTRRLSLDKQDRLVIVAGLEASCRRLRAYISEHYNEATFHAICKEATIDSLRGTTLWQLLYGDENEYSLKTLDDCFEDAVEFGDISMLALVKMNYLLFIMRLEQEVKRMKGEQV